MRTEVDEPVDHHRRGLDLPAGRHLPDDASLAAIERGHGPALRRDDDARPVDRRGRGKRPADAAAPLHLAGLGVERVRRAFEGVHVEVALAVDRRELDVAPHPPCPDRLLFRQAQVGVSPGERALRVGPEGAPAALVRYLLGGGRGLRLRRRLRRRRDGDVVELGVERTPRLVLGKADREQDGAETDNEHGNRSEDPPEGSWHE